jgi:hypothetical protein
VTRKLLPQSKQKCASCVTVRVDRPRHPRDEASRPPNHRETAIAAVARLSIARELAGGSRASKRTAAILASRPANIRRSIPESIRVAKLAPLGPTV